MVKLGGLSLDTPLMNAAGSARTIADVERLSRTGLGAIVVGSYTPEARPGMSGDTYYRADGYSLNSRSLPNGGKFFMANELPKMRELAHAKGQPLIVSIAAYNANDLVIMAIMASLSGADMLEVNLSCPNQRYGGEQSAIPCYNPGLTAASCQAVELGLERGRKIPYLVKVGPMADPALMPKLTEILKITKAAGVVVCNTFPNSLALYPDGRPCLSGTVGGMSGSALHPIALGNAYSWRKLLPKRMCVVGVGGISTALAMLDFFAVGCTAVQVGSAYLDAHEDPRIFDQLLADFYELVEIRGLDL